MVSLEVWKFGVKLAISDPAHELAQLEHHKVNISHVVAHQELLFGQEVSYLACLLEADLRDSFLVAPGVAWHGGCTLEVRDDAGYHLDFTVLAAVFPEKMLAPLVADVLLDR